MDFIPDPTADAVLVGGVEIEQVLFNLLRNAVQAMEHVDHGKIRISNRLCDGMVEVRIEDSGDGISSDPDGQLFLPIATEKANGLGMGLAICRMIIETHGGKIWFGGSELGGAAACFTIPAMRAIQAG